ncbi:MAG: hypothetical protein MJZ06_05050 [Bacteroidaceae bacterium]|nr:hypothetical protein [Bacteroidaceae bacterium]
MRRNILAVTLTVCAALLLTGCERAVNMTGKPVEFSAGISDGRSESGTRVVYGEITGTGTKSQSLDWEIGDELTISCAQCESKKISDYKVTGVTGPDEDLKSYASIVNAETDGIGLRWGENVDHIFYAVYPSPAAGSVTASLTGGVATGTIPASQPQTPDLVKTMMMTATKTWKEDSFKNDENKVLLEFKPITTAVEFTIKNGFEGSQSAMNISSVALISDGHALNGGFKVDMTKSGRSGRPLTTLSNATVSDADRKVTIDFGSTPASVAYGETLTFTFFLNPGNESEINDLTLEIRGKDANDANLMVVRRAKLADNSTGITFPTHQKTIVNGIVVPESIIISIDNEVVVSPWIDGGTTDINPR